MTDMTNTENSIVADLRKQGYAVVIFSPEEIGLADPTKVEAALIEYGNDSAIPSLSPVTGLDMLVFTNAYLECALWSSTDEFDVLLLDNYSADDLSASAKERAEEDCKDFINTDKAGNKILEAILAVTGYTWASAGHDFWLTRNRHGAGFWDRGLPGTLGQELSDIAHTMGTVDLYTGDDGQLYFQP